MTNTKKKTSSTVTKLHQPKEQPTSRMLSPYEEFDNLLEQLRQRDWTQLFHWPDAVQSHIPLFAEGKIPKVDIIDHDKDLLIRAELPGVEKKDLDISMTDNSITIKATTSYEQKEEKGNYHRSEIAHGKYLRTLALPAGVDVDKVKSTFKNGVLELTVPKFEHSHRRTIKID